MKNHYVDSTELECIWSDWIAATMAPTLEPYRELRALWVRETGGIEGTSGPVQGNHCIVIGETLIYFEVDQHVVIAGSIKTDQGSSCKLPLEVSLDDQLKYVHLTGEIAPPPGYRCVPTAKQAWGELIGKISLICDGVLKKLGVRMDIRDDIASDVMLLVIRKLRQGKLRFEPGKAPVFNLLTTTLMNCASSCLAKENRVTSNKHKLVDGLVNGSIPPIYRSLAMVH